MLRVLAICTACVFGSSSLAAPLNSLDLVLSLESIGFTSVEIYDDDGESIKFGFLNVDDDVWGLTKPHARFSVGEKVSLSAQIDAYGKMLSTCSIGGFSCKGAYGERDGDTFSIGDAAGMTLWGDFNLAGGTDVGDKVSLATFSGGPNYEALDDGGYAFWDAYTLNFTVTENKWARGDDPVRRSAAAAAAGVVPVPASVGCLVAGLGVLGWISRRRRASMTSKTA